MRAWIGCMASYNNGRLHGEWFDVSTDPDENAANIAKVLRSSPYPNVTKTDPDTGETYATAEEYYVADYEAPRALTQALGEYPGAEQLAEAAEIEEAVSAKFDDEDEAAAVIDVMLDGRKLADVDDAAEWISDHYAGKGDNLADWCQEFLEETGFFEELKGERAATVIQYFDYESYARDMRLGGEISETRVSGSVLVFWNH